MTEVDRTRTSGILAEVSKERDRQDAKWGEQNHRPLYWLAVLGEKYGEACKGLMEAPRPPIFEEYRKELIEVAAVAVAAVESLDRGKWRNT